MKTRRALAAPPGGLAHRIASVRKGLGLSQRGFAEAVGVARNTVVTYEHGQIPCTEAAIEAVVPVRAPVKEDLAGC
jgi:DNA-binding XRE family transcriptional regulator